MYLINNKTITLWGYTLGFILGYINQQLTTTGTILLCYIGEGVEKTTTPNLTLKGSAMFNLEFSLQELHELHVTLVVRKCQLEAQLNHKSADVAAIAMRQLERISPMLYYVSSVVTEHHVNDKFMKDIEDATEKTVEREMDRLDKKLMQGHITQADYDARVQELDRWAKSSMAA